MSSFLFLSKMGYRDVRSIHGAMEFGKDVVFSQQDPLARERHYAVVIKRGPLSGSVSSSGSLRSAFLQIEQSLDTPFIDPRNGKDVSIDGVYLITAAPISQQAISSCRGALGAQGNRVSLIDGPALFDLLKEYYPDFAWSLPKDLPQIEDEVEKKDKKTGMKKAFVLMPFGGYFDSYYSTVYKPGLEAAGFFVQRADDMSSPRPIIKDIQTAIVAADLILCDMSGRNANVFHELGLAHAVGKPVTLLSDDLSEVPFDLRHIRIIVYDRNLPDWGSKLRDSIRASALSIDPNDVWPPPLGRED